MRNCVDFSNKLVAWILNGMVLVANRNFRFILSDRILCLCSQAIKGIRMESDCCSVCVYGPVIFQHIFDFQIRPFFKATLVRIVDCCTKYDDDAIENTENQ